MKLTRRALLLTALPGVLLTVAGLVAGLGFGLRINTTKSLPLGLYQVTDQVHKGGYVSACVPLDAPTMRMAIERHYFPDGTCPGGVAPLLKHVAAVPGDTVTLTAEAVIINGQALANTKTIYQDRYGARLEPVARGTFTVPPDTYWLIANENRGSYDSRYFGPVPKAAIEHAMRPVLLF